jgi:hypothetical protein
VNQKIYRHKKKMKIDEALVICVTTFFRRKVGILTTSSQQIHIWPHPKKIVVYFDGIRSGGFGGGLKNF